MLPLKYTSTMRSQPPYLVCGLMSWWNFSTSSNVLLWAKCTRHTSRKSPPQLWRYVHAISNLHPWSYIAYNQSIHPSMYACIHPPTNQSTKSTDTPNHNHNSYLFNAVKKMDTAVKDHLFILSAESLTTDITSSSTSSIRLYQLSCCI